MRAAGPAGERRHVHEYIATTVGGGDESESAPGVPLRETAIDTTAPGIHTVMVTPATRIARNR